MQVRSLSREDPLEEGVATHSRILAWRIPWTEKPGRIQSMGLQVRCDWACMHGQSAPWLKVLGASLSSSFLPFCLMDQDIDLVLVALVVVCQGLWFLSPPLWGAVRRDSGLPLEMGPFLLALQKSPDVQALSIEALPAVESFPSKKWFWPSPGLELKHFWQKWFPGNWANSVPLLLRMRCFCGRMDG